MKYAALLLTLAVLTGCGSNTPASAPTDPASLKASQDEQKMVAEGEGASQKPKK